MTVPKRFGILRVVGWVFKVFAWIVLVLSILFAIMMAVGGAGLANLLPPDNPMAGFVNMGGGLIAGLGTLLIGVFYFLLLYASGESFHLQIALEENTRLTAALLLRMHQESQQDTRTGYNTPAFESERFER